MNLKNKFTHKHDSCSGFCEKQPAKNRSKQLAAFLLVLFLAVSVNVTTVSPVEAIVISLISPSSGPVGTTVRLTGTIDTEGGGFHVYFDIDNDLDWFEPSEKVVSGYAPLGSHDVDVEFVVPDCSGSVLGTSHLVTLFDVQAASFASWYFIVTLNLEPPVASFTYSPPNPKVGRTVIFDASSSYDPDGFIICYNWDFGDGSVANGVNPTHSYSSDGIYTVSLTVYDPNLMHDTTTQTVTVVPLEPPVAYFGYFPISPKVGEPVTFSASPSSDPDGTIVSYVWYFGDGNEATGENPFHSYLSDGSYTVSLTVTDNDGLTDTTTQTITVAPPDPPVASFTYSKDGQTVTFDASGSSDPDGTIVSYGWQFGDGSTGTGVNPSHSYSSYGSYTVSLTVTDNDGYTDTTTQTVTISDVNTPPVASFTHSPTSPTVGQTITFDTATSFDPDGTIVNYDWQFGDGSTGTGANPTHSYQSTGTYTVTLTVTDDDGLTDTQTESVTVSSSDEPDTTPPDEEVPVASFTYSKDEQTITFDASGSSDPDGTIVSYGWQFGDGSTGTGVNPSHSYSSDGTYTVTLTVTDNDGLTDTQTRSITISSSAEPDSTPTDEEEPIASFTISKDGQTATFDASTSNDLDGSIVNYAWQFGDGTTGTGVNPSHSYSSDGTYIVTLTVTDNDGLIDTQTESVTVSSSAEPEPDVTSPVADAGDDMKVKTGSIVTFDGSACSDDVGIVNYEWDFGDGITGTGKTPTHTYTAEGNYAVYLRVTDAAGNFDIDTLIVTVVTEEESTSLWILIPIIGGIIGSTFAIFYLETKKPKGKTPQI